MSRLECASEPLDSHETNKAGALVRIGGLVAILVLAVVMAIATWGKWPDVLIDFGRELYVPWRILEGEHPHKDFAYLNGPFSPYFNALLFRLFGVSLRTLIVANLAILALMVTLIYSLFLKVGGYLAATLAGVLVILLFAFNQYFADVGNYNYVCPYSHELTHGLTLSFAAIWCFSRYVDKTKLRWALAMGCLTGLSFLTKPEVFLALAAAIALGLVLAAWTERLTIRRISTLLLTVMLGLSAPVLIAAVLLSSYMPVASSVRSVVGAWPLVLAGEVARLPQYQARMGLADPTRSFRLLGLSSAAYVICLILTVGISILVKRWLQARKPATRLGWLLAAASGILALDLLLGAVLARWSQDAFRPLPLVLVLVAAVTLVALLRTRSDLKARRIELLRLTLVIFALVLMFKMLLYVRLHHYGFALAMPATLVLSTTLVVWLPHWLRWKSESKLAFRVLAINVCIIIVAVFLMGSFKNYAQKTHTVGDGPDAFFADWRGPYVNTAIEQVSEHAGPNDTLVVIPDGEMLNYLTRRVNPHRYRQFIPPTFALRGDQVILEMFIASAPDWIVIVPRDCSEFGPRFFGIDFGLELWDWIEQKYEAIYQVGKVPPQDHGSGMEVFRRRPGTTQD